MSPQREGKVRTQKESDGVRGTHPLETAEGGTIQDEERKQLREENFLETAAEPTSQDTARKQSECHSLSGDCRGGGGRGISQDMERKRSREGHSLPGA